MSSREQRLREILARESAQKVPVGQRSPPMFRDMMPDTHRTLPPEQFGVAGAFPGTKQASMSSSGLYNKRDSGFKGQVSEWRRTTGPKNGASLQSSCSGLQGPVEFRSVFKPRPEQEPACAAANERRKLIMNNEWALLDTLEVEMSMREKEARERHLQQLQAAQRKALDVQVKEHEAARRAEEAEIAKEKKIVQEEVERFKFLEIQKAKEEKALHQELRKQREDMLEKARAARLAAQRAKHEEEVKELDAAARMIEEDCAKLAAKAEAAKRQQEQLTRENEARLQARKVALAKEKEQDEVLMQQTLATLARQEEERKEKLKAFHENIAARGNRAGVAVVADRKDRAEREERLIKQFELQKEEEYKVKEALAADKKARLKAERIEARKVFLAEQAAKAAAAKAKGERARQETEDHAYAAAVAHERKMAAIRERDMAHGQNIRAQMAEVEHANRLDDTSMTDRERALNSQLLQAATQIVGQPKQMSIKLF